MGKLPTSRRYNLLPLLRSSPGGFAGSWPYRTYPYTCLKKISIQRHTPVFCKLFTLAKVVHFFHLSKHNDKIISNAATLPNKNRTQLLTKTRPHGRLFWHSSTIFPKIFNFYYKCMMFFCTFANFQKTTYLNKYRYKERSTGKLETKTNYIY